MSVGVDTLQPWTDCLSDKERELLIKSVATCCQCCQNIGNALRRATYENVSTVKATDVEFKNLSVKCLMSLTHASEIIGYCSNNKADRTLFRDIYKKLMKWFCMKPESEEAMHYRLADNRKYVYVRSILRRCRESGKYYLIRLNAEEESQYVKYAKTGKVEFEDMDKEKLDFLLYDECGSVDRKDYVEIDINFISKFSSLTTTQKHLNLYSILSNKDKTHSLAEKLYYISHCYMEDEYYIGSDNKVKRR